VADKTSWQKRLKGEAEPQNMQARREELFSQCKSAIKELSASLDDDAIVYLDSEETIDISYPVNIYPEKVKSFNFGQNT